jgi:hypothetical protein
VLVAIFWVVVDERQIHEFVWIERTRRDAAKVNTGRSRDLKHNAIRAILF